MIEQYVFVNNSTIAACEVDGVNCSKISNNGNELYLPVTGFRKDTEDGSAIARDLDYLNPWSADKIQRSATNAGWDAAYAVYFKQDGSGSGMDRYGHFCGLPVRPVLTKSTVTNN